MHKVRLIVAGSRSYTNEKLFEEILSQLLTRWKKEDVLLISGKASHGPDDMVIRYAKKHGYECREYPALWDVYGKPAGMIRNAEMAKAAKEGEPTFSGLLVFWDGISPGTANMIENAAKHGLERFLVFFDAAEQEAPYYPAMRADRVVNNRAVEGRAIFRDEALYIGRLLGYNIFPPDHTTVPWEKMEKVILKAREDYAAKRIPLTDTTVLTAFLKFVDEHMLYITAERLPVRFDEPAKISEGMNPNLH